MGLDQGDVIIRRRLTQKIQYLFGDLIQTPEPSEAELTAFLSEQVRGLQVLEFRTPRVCRVTLQS